MTSTVDMIKQHKELVQQTQKSIYDAELLLAADLAAVDMENEIYTKTVDIDASTVKVTYYLKSKPIECGGRPVKTVIYYHWVP